MLKDLFSSVLENYIDGSTKTDKTDPIYNVLIHKIPKSLETLFPMRRDLLVAGSCGRGQKTDYPWIAIYNKNITSSAQRGLYLVYLFKKDMTGFYISLNQGITYYSETYKRKKYEYARKVADYFRNEIGDEYFDKGDIDLGGIPGTLGYGYQETNIISKYYAKGSFTTEQLERDLLKILAIYDELAGVLGEDAYDYNNAVKKILFTDADSFEPADEAIENIKKAIFSAVDVSVTRSLKNVEPKERRTKKYSKIRSVGPTKKIDYIAKAKSDLEVGLLGEDLALEYERDKLIRLGYPELAKKVRQVSIISDAYGYDIESYEFIGSKMEKVYLEVKTTTNKLDVDFPVSKNEVEESHRKKGHYCIFRIYDAKSVNPSFYKVFGKIEDNFELDPVSYLARYTGKK